MLFLDFGVLVSVPYLWVPGFWSRSELWVFGEKFIESL